MLIPRPRSAIFRACPFADYFVAEMQKSYASDFDPADPEHRAVLKKYYDHLEPLQPPDWPAESSCVLAWKVEGIKEYEAGIGGVLQRFYAALGIGELYLLDFLNKSMARFPFETFRKRNAFRRLCRGGLEHNGYLMQTSDLAAVLPLLLFSGVYDVPVIFFIAADGTIPLSLRLCDDGNFHANYPARHSAQVKEAVERAGLTLGDDHSLCWDFSITALRNGAYRDK